MDGAIVGVCGAGVTGQSVGRVLAGLGMRVAWYDPAAGAAVRARRRFGGVVVDGIDELRAADAVVLAMPGPQYDLTASLVADGVHIQVDRTYPLAAYDEALTRLEHGEQLGKIVLTHEGN